MTLAEKRLHINGLQLSQRIRDGTPQKLCHLLRIAMRATEGLAHDTVDETQGFQTMRGNAEGLCRIRRFLCTFPEDGGAALG